MELWPYLDLVRGPPCTITTTGRHFFVFWVWWEGSSSFLSPGDHQSCEVTWRRTGRASGHAPFFFWFEADGMGIPGVVCYTAPVLQQHEGLIIHDLQNVFSPPEFPFHHQICKNKSVRRFKFIINNLLKQQLPFDRLFGLKESAHWCHLHMYWFRGSEIRPTSTCFVSGESPIFQRGSSSYLAGGLLG